MLNIKQNLYANAKITKVFLKLIIWFFVLFPAIMHFNYNEYQTHKHYTTKY